MYCNAQVAKSKRGEHVVPESIGGALTLNEISDKRVCNKCNGGVLSEIDRELCSRSPLSVVASQEIDAHVWQTWDVDHAAGNLLVEAKPRWEGRVLSALIPYPQIVFERKGLVIRGDAEEVERFGFKEFEAVMRKAVRGVFYRFRAGSRRALHFERIQDSRQYR